MEYTPYGETWVEKTGNIGLEFLPYRFTGKEIDEETGLYYYGARYLDSKYSRWISTDPALGEYIPADPVSDEARKHNENLPGMGGLYNFVNFNLYHYAGNNPVKYTDPDGRVANFIIGAFIGATVGAVTSIAVQTTVNMIKNGGDLNAAINDVDLKSVGTAAFSGAISGAITGGISEVSTVYNSVKAVKAVVNAGANIVGTTAGTLVDNAGHNQKLSKNLVRNNIIAGGAGILSAAISTTAAGSIVDKYGQKTSVWFETLDSGGKIISITTKEPIDVAVNNFIKEFGISMAQESLSKIVEDK
ncbi:MAG: RHS repeat-associated core domain-containing protein [Treponema sp.]|nr:RHS repeat-associated core domain-containing protein [Treponema sp.]